MRNGYSILVGNAGRKKPFRKSRRRLEVNMEMDVKEIFCDVVD
jgi:hypothetical protein